MRFPLFLIIVLATLLSACGTSRDVAERKVKPAITTDGGEVLILFYDPRQLTKEQLEKHVRDYHATLIYVYNNFNGMAFRLPSGTTADEGIRHFKAIKGVLSVDKDRKVELH